MSHKGVTMRGSCCLLMPALEAGEESEPYSVRIYLNGAINAEFDGLRMAKVARIKRNCEKGANWWRFTAK